MEPLTMPHARGRERVLVVVVQADITKTSLQTLQPLISTAARCATKKVTALLVSDALTAEVQERAQLFTFVQHFVSTVASLISTNIESLSLEIELLLFGWSELGTTFSDIDAVYCNTKLHVEQILELKDYIHIETSDDATVAAPSAASVFQGLTESVSEIRSVSVNGTFDHLHLGHRVLLLMSAWLTSETLFCSVSTASPDTISHKRLVQLSETYHRRRNAVGRYFDRLHCPSNRPFDLKLLPRQDYGIQVTERTLQAIVLSAESKKHGDIVNSKRLEAGLPLVKVFIVETVLQSQAGMRASDPADHSIDRMSSSAIRSRMQKRRPVFILLNGYPGVGKATIALHLEILMRKLGIEVRLPHNRLMMDLADAICSEATPTYQRVREQLQELVFDSIVTDEHIQPGTTFVFTTSLTDDSTGKRSARDYLNTARRCEALLCPVTLRCAEEEHKSRKAAQIEERISLHKVGGENRMHQTSTGSKLYEFCSDHRFDLDITALSASQAAECILEHVKEVMTNASGQHAHC